MRMGTRLQFSLGCPGKDLVKRHFFSKDLQEMRESVMQVPGEAAAEAPARGSTRCRGERVPGPFKEGQAGAGQTVG